MKISIVFAVVLIGIQADSFLDIDEQWKTFKATYNKEYENHTVEEFRKKIFTENLHTIETHNQRFAEKLVSYRLGINKFADMRNEDFVSCFDGYNSRNRMISNKHEITFIPPANVELPNSVDWRNMGAVTEAKDQGQCGSCYTFSTTGALEAQIFRKTGRLVSLSEQNLIDCSVTFGNKGCKGGAAELAFTYIQYNKGIDTEQSYPYEDRQNVCRYNPINSVGTITGYVRIEHGNEEQLKYAVATVGPVAAVFDASSLSPYANGVYNHTGCNSTYINHAVLVVGYGTTKNGQDYWIVKNSWGSNWGQKGFFLTARNNNNKCGIATQASYPVV